MSNFFTGDGLGCLEIDDEYEFSYESDILDMYRRAAARSAPLSKDFCASLAQANCWEDWGTAMVAALRAPGGRARGLRLRSFGKVALAVSTPLFQRSSLWLSRFLAVYSSYQIVTVIRVCQPSPSFSCSVIAVAMCVTEALGPKLICHLLISLSSSPIDFLPCT